MRRKGTRVLGPYRDRERNDWRVVLIEPAEEGSKRSAFRFACETGPGSAAEFIANTEEELKLEGPITVEDALKEYEGWKHARGGRGSSIGTTMQRLRNLLRGTGGDRRIQGLVAGHAAAAYTAYAAGRSVDTHRNALGEARTFGKWCVRKGYLRHNPWAEVEAVGARSAGKLQLRVDEARKWLAKAVELAELGDEGAVAAMMTLLMGLRASEVVERVARDVDDGGALLWIDHSKTVAGRRVLDVPAVLRPALGRLDGRGAGMDAAGHRRLFCHDRHWVRANVKRICRLAGVPEVGAHAMRGAHASFAMQAGASSQLVASALGHASPAVTLKHYAEPGAVADGKARATMKVLAGGKR